MFMRILLIVFGIIMTALLSSIGIRVIVEGTGIQVWLGVALCIVSCGFLIVPFIRD